MSCGFNAVLVPDASCTTGGSGTVRVMVYSPGFGEVASTVSLTIAPDPEPGQGSYYRSDHFSFARVGIPAFSVEQGTNYIGKPANFGKTIFEEYNTKHYHQPSDEYHDDWDFTGMQQMADFGLALGIDIANLPNLPTWKAGDEFLAARQKSEEGRP